MPSRSLVPTTLVAVALLGLTLTGCGVGRNPETYRERPTVDAAIADVGAVALRNTSISPPRDGEEEYAVGADAPLSLTVVNTADRPDVLLSVSTTAATTTQLLDAEGAPVTQVDLPPGPTTPTQFSVVLSTLTAALRPGQSVPVTFTFRDSGRTTLIVPVEVYTQPAPAPAENPFEHGAGAEE